MGVELGSVKKGATMVSGERDLKGTRFHWSLSQVGDPYRRAQSTQKMAGLIPLEEQLAFCSQAEALGMESLLIAMSFSRPEPLVLATVLAMETQHLKFMIACRPGLVSPAFFVQQVNSLSQLTQGRIHLNIVSGHSPQELGYYGDFLAHEQRYARADEFLEVCRTFWQGQESVDHAGRFYRITQGHCHTPFYGNNIPQIYVGGNSYHAVDLASRHADCLWCFPDEEEKLASTAAQLQQQGRELGLLVSLLARPTTEQAHEAAAALIAPFGEDARRVQEGFAQRADAKGFQQTYHRAMSARSPWLASCLWTGAVPYLGAPAIALVGSYVEVAQALLAYKKLGIAQFLFMGWPDLDELRLFGEQVLPLYRELERGEIAGADL